MNVYRGQGTKVHEAITLDGVAAGTRCWFDVHYNNVDRQLRETTAPVDCKICLGDRVGIPQAAVVVPASCPKHGGKVHTTKTVKAGRYTQFTCGCKVWH